MRSMQEAFPTPPQSIKFRRVRRQRLVETDGCALRGAVALIGTADFQWDNQCDRCGAHETLLTPTMLRLGHLTISGHVCDQRWRRYTERRADRAEPT
jgi:hypothetical protein